jgi:hypothetical protein
MNHWLRNVVAALALVVPVLAQGSVVAHASSFVGDDLQGYYPNTTVYQTQYLQGRNYVVNPSSYAVLWFERQDQYTFLQHNGQPGGSQAACNTDYLSWWPDHYLRYVKTINSCGSQTTDIDYYGTQGNPIIFLPEFWDGNPWVLSGTSSATYSVNGTVTCTGTSAWTARIYGVELIAPGESGLHWRTSQTLSLGGSGCAPTTHWQEDYWLVQDLPSPNGPQKALKRTQGGDLDTTYPAWNIWMDDWAARP